MAAGFLDNLSQMLGHTFPEVSGYSRYSVNTNMGYRRKEQGKMDLHLIMNWEKNPVKMLKK